MKKTRKNVILFVDDEDMARCAGLDRVFHPATKHSANPVFGPGDGLDNCRHLTVSTVRKEAGGFRMWYYAYPVRGTSILLYAESDNGVDWHRPKLGLYEDFDGNKDNNIFLNRMAMRYPGAKLPEGRAADIHPNVLYTPHLGP